MAETARMIKETNHSSLPEDQNLQRSFKVFVLINDDTIRLNFACNKLCCRYEWKNQTSIEDSHPLLCITKNSMRMNNDYICRYYVGLLDGMIDDDHVLRLM